MVIFAEVTENECIDERHWHPLVKGDNLTLIERKLENGAR